MRLADPMRQMEKPTMTTRPSRRTACGAGLLRVAAIVLIAATALVTGSAGQRASAQEGRKIPVIQIQSPARIGVDDITLPEVAQLTLGNAGLANEIFQLNVDRPQQVGGELTNPNQQLEVGWVLELPQGASGPLVQFITEGGSSGSGGSGSAGSGNSGTSSNSGTTSHGSTSNPRTTHVGATRVVTIGGLKLQLPILLAEIGGLLLLGLTLFILLRRRAARGARKDSLGRRLAAWLTGPSSRRRERASRVALGQAWRADTYSPGLARAALAEARQVIPATVPTAIAADVRKDSIRVLPAPDLAPPQPWGADPEASRTWIRPRFSGYVPPVNDAMCRPVRVGGDQDGQMFVDVSHCDGAIALTGDSAVASEVLLALLDEFGEYHPDLGLAVLGTVQPGSVRANMMRDSGELAALIGPAAPAFDSPVRAAAARRRITGVVAVLGDAPTHESLEVARLCALRGSTWLALIVGDVPGAHWRWDLNHAGRVRLSALGRTVVAPL
jgi:hypothetical protein